MLPYRSAPGIPCELASLPRPLRFAKGASGPEGGRRLGCLCAGSPSRLSPGPPHPSPLPRRGEGIVAPVHSGHPSFVLRKGRMRAGYRFDSNVYVVFVAWMGGVWLGGFFWDGCWD